TTRDASTQTADEDFLPLETTRDASTQTSEEDFGVLEQMNSEGNNSAVISITSKQNRKRNASSDQMITHDRDAHKRSRLEICGMSDPVISIFNEQDGINPDSGIDISATTGQIELENTCLTGIYPEFPNSEESHSQNQVIKELDNLESNNILTIMQNNSSNMNISQNENTPDNF
ncbi:hypothetical protein AVEN_15324-1, partial [Araneus ventricosus]